MLITLARGLILYVTIAVFMRFMGKRQLGELQPTELVITILLSEIVAMPMENNESPLIYSLFSSMMLVCLEIINSVFSMKNYKINQILQGKSAVIIENGILNQKKLKDLRYSPDDLLEQLRQKDVFDINEVSCAIIETNGNLSLKKKAEFEPLTSEILGMRQKDKPIPVLVIHDGKILNKNLQKNKNLITIMNTILNIEQLNHKDVLILLISDLNDYTLIKKDQQ